MARKITIEFLGEDRDLQKTINQVDGSSSKLGGTLKKVGKAAAIGLGAGLLVGGAALVKMTQGAIEDEKAQELLAKTLKNTTDATDEQVASVEDWIAKQGKALGVTDDELRPAMQRLAEATGDVGKAQELASLAMDVSAGTGKSLKTVSEALAKAQNGQISGLSRLGIETKNAAGETLNFEQATKKMSETFDGQASKAAGTTEGKFKRLKVQFDEVQETIGAKLIPIAEKLVSWILKDGIPAAEKFARVAGPVMKKALEAIGDAFRDVARAGKWMWENVLQPTFSTMLDVLENVALFAAGMLDALSKAPGMGWAAKAADKLRKVAEQAADADRAIRGIPSYKTVTVGINFLYPKGKPTKNIEDTDDWLNDLGNSSRTTAAMDQVKAGAKGFLDGKMKQLLEPAGAALISGLVSGIDKKKKSLDSVLGKISEQVKKAKDKLATLLDNRQSIVDSFKGFASSVFGADTATEDSPASAQKLVDFSAGQRGKAETLSADVKALIAKGLSKDLINELIASGQSGMDQIHLLAGATGEQIAALNANQAATQAALTAAGLAAADAVMGEQIAQAQRDVKLADDIRDKLQALLEKQDKNTIVQLILDGKVLRASLLKLKRESGRNLELA